MVLIKKAKAYYRVAYTMGHFPGIGQLLNKKKKVFAYFGHLGDNNFGDELVFEAIKALVAPHIVLPIRKRMPFFHLIFLKFFASKFSGIVIGGGTMIGPKFVDRDLFEHIVSNSKAVYLHGTGVHNLGKYDQGWIEQLSKNVFGGIRGPLSQKNLREIDINLEIVGDAAFIFLPNQTAENTNSKKVLINLGTHDRYAGDEYARGETIRFMTYLIKNDYNVSFLPFHEADMQIGSELRQQFTDLTLLTIPKTFQEATFHFRQHCFAVGERLHFNIVALLSNCPFLSINYNKKHEDFLLSVDCSNYGVSPSEVTVEYLIQSFKDRSNVNWKVINKNIASLQDKQISSFKEFSNL